MYSITMNTPLYRITPTREEWVLTASSSCPCCNGRGEVRESHGEWLYCDCPFDRANPEVIELIEAGAAFSIEPCPDWIERMNAMQQEGD